MQGKDGQAVLGGASIESMFVHESQHAYDSLQGNLRDLKNSTTNTIFAENKSEDNAITEANKYRAAVEEALRLWYRTQTYPYSIEK